MKTIESPRAAQPDSPGQTPFFGKSAEETPAPPGPFFTGRLSPVNAAPQPPAGEGEKRGDSIIQPKLVIGQARDPYEQEADAVAEKIVNADAPKTGHTTAAGPFLQRACDECSIEQPSGEELEEDVEPEPGAEEPLSRKTDDSGAADTPPAAGPKLESALQQSRGGGSPLPTETLGKMESNFGQDFGHVRVHTDSQAASLNRSVQAKAFTYQSDIYFNTGQYNPGAREGQRLLAHELTHVVQQTGSRPSVQPSLQRAPEPKIGNWAHAQIQHRLRHQDKKLITEAPIPGGTRDVKAINSVGFADLYKAQGMVVSGISAQEPAASKDLPAAQKFYNYVNMRQDYIAGAQSQSPINAGPTIARPSGTWSFTHNFPQNFHIGEIKPLFPTEFPQSLAYHGLGRIQVGNYTEGFREFIERVYRDNPPYQAQLPATSVGRPLVIPDDQIPAPINYRRFEQERLRTPAEGIYKRDRRPFQRIWLYRFRDGVYVYFLLPQDYTSNEFPRQIEAQLTRLDPLLARLRQRQPRMGAALGRKPDDRAAKPAVGIRGHAKPGIQAKGENWGELAKKWEADRKNWVGAREPGAAKPKDFLKEQARGVTKKIKVDDKLGVSTTDATLREQMKAVGKIRFWSSFRGRLFGALRFRFGRVFFKIEEVFEKIKTNFQKHRANAAKLNEKNGVFDGWKKVATKAIIRFGVEIFKEMITLAFQGFINCINGIIDAIFGRFTKAVDGAKQELFHEVEPVCCEIMSFKNELETEYAKHEQTVASFTEAVETIREWRAVLDNVETAVRIGVQIVSCGTPPALGCLWGLVAQLGISTGLNLLARTDYFEQEIAKPAARALLDAIVGDALHNFLIDLLERTPLQPFVAEAKTCERRSAVIGNKTIGDASKLDPNDPKIAQARLEWEQEFQADILKDLQTVFEKGKGKAVTQEDLNKLVELIRTSGKKPEEIKQMIFSARNPASGKLNLEQAAAAVQSGAVPAAETKERHFDVEKATRNNPVYQQLLGWDPLTFVAKPGIQAGSVEFAEAVYDLQKALGQQQPDGMLGEATLIRFYERNKLKKDAAYREAQRQSEKKKAEREKQAEKDKPAESRDPATNFTVLNAADYPVRRTEFQLNPTFVKAYLAPQSYREIVTDRANPPVVSVDLYVNRVHTHRMQNVAVDSIRFSEILAMPENIPYLTVTFKDGFQIQLQGEEVVVYQIAGAL